ncbi:nucleotidyltransferase family protein [Tahibacter harae]|uniref:Nucleotidyltransferase family protein n=1 Tax=Tahibacter harae TaxID=2963937 RepID=A0ABT1QN73_9GAMM|nr:nucleotidyltransferase family protein [Tahibacter harae]MCQ4163969.1 nucleotidyltransferase family protein [Tahibacter harae]
MKALIFAAGKGTRMQPLTAHTPKPLLSAGGRRLIDWQLQRLAAAGVDEVVINTSWLAEQFPAVLGERRGGLRLHYSAEGTEPLETGGGLLLALPLLGAAPFLAVNGDVYCDMDLSTLKLDAGDLAALALVANPAHHPRGDFHLRDGRLLDESIATGAPRLTFAGIGLYRPELLQGWRSIIGDEPGARQNPPCFKLAPLLYAAARAGRAAGLLHRGRWTDVGTPQRLAELDAELSGAA